MDAGCWGLRAEGSSLESRDLFAFGEVLLQRDQSNRVEQRRETCCQPNFSQLRR